MSTQTPLALLREQRSHLLLILSEPASGAEDAFVDWYLSQFSKTAAGLPTVVQFQQYKQHAIDVTRGRYPRLPFRYLSVAELSLDGAEGARAVIDAIASLHANEVSARPPAAWLYYPVSERVGRSPSFRAALTVAYANGIGPKEEFREFYTTRHIRHALNIAALASGQCFERTQFQSPGAAPADYEMIAIYETTGEPDDIVHSFETLPAGTLAFPTLDRAHFTECVYSPLD